MLAEGTLENEAPRDLSDIRLLYLFLDGIAERLTPSPQGGSHHQHA